MLLTLLHDAFVMPGELWRSWTLDAWIVLPVIVSSALYAVGVRRLWRASAAGRGVRRTDAAAFAAGTFFLAVALISPLDALGGALFSAHMLQHVLLMLVAAPLLVLGRPLVAFVWALPRGWRPRVGAAFHTPGVRASWHAVTHPISAWLLHAAAIWVWHAPGLYQATLGNELVHFLQHASFFGTALLFWWAALEMGRRTQARHGFGVLYIFTTAVHSSILGALLTFSLLLWYPIYATRTEVWGFTALEDQQLGGLIMWVPAGVVYVVATLALVAAWLAAAEQRARSHTDVLLGGVR
jgi:putative membrane protein